MDTLHMSSSVAHLEFVVSALYDCLGTPVWAIVKAIMHLDSADSLPQKEWKSVSYVFSLGLAFLHRLQVQDSLASISVVHIQVAIHGTTVNQDSSLLETVNQTFSSTLQ